MCSTPWKFRSTLIRFDFFLQFSQMKKNRINYILESFQIRKIDTAVVLYGYTPMQNMGREEIVIFGQNISNIVNSKSQLMVVNQIKLHIQLLDSNKTFKIPSSTPCSFSASLICLLYFQMLLTFKLLLQWTTFNVLVLGRAKTSVTYISYN